MSATYEQTPSPQETQFAGVLQMGVQELRDYVETALQENPVFELSDPGEEMLEDPNFARKREWLEAGDWQDSYYQGQDEAARSLGKRLLQTQESNVERMKAYL